MMRKHRAAPVAMRLAHGVAAPIMPPAEPCDMAPLHGTAPTRREWLLITSHSSRLRVRRSGSSEWLTIAQPRDRGPEGILARTAAETWRAGKQVQSDSLLMIAWADVERVDQRSGRTVYCVEPHAPPSNDRPQDSER